MYCIKLYLLSVFENTKIIVALYIYVCTIVLCSFLKIYVHIYRIPINSCMEYIVLKKYGYKGMTRSTAVILGS